MKLIVNGQQVNKDVSSVLDLLKSYQLDPKQVVVELNKQIIKRENFEQTTLCAEDQVEIVGVVGGG